MTNPPFYTTIQEIPKDEFPLFWRAYEYASEKHRNDVRKDGKPYMTHVDAVILGTIYELSRKSPPVALKNIQPFQYEIFLVVAALHDVFEDHRELSLSDIADILTPLLPDQTAEEVIRHITYGVMMITKKPKGEELYRDYVGRVHLNLYAHCVKIADLKHNMSDLSPGNLKDKYDLTLSVLGG